MTHRRVLAALLLLPFVAASSAAYAAPKLPTRAMDRPDPNLGTSGHLLGVRSIGPYAGPAPRPDTQRSCTIRGGRNPPSGRAGRTFRQSLNMWSDRLTKSSLDHKAAPVIPAQQG